MAIKRKHNSRLTGEFLNETTITGDFPRNPRYSSGVLLSKSCKNHWKTIVEMLDDRKITCRKSEGESPIYAALDLGTNNCRLLIACPDYRYGEVFPALKILDSYSRIVRLGEGLGKQGALSQEAMQRTLKALKVCRAKLDKYPSAKVRLVATEACRRASNSAEFIQKVQQEINLDIEIISNEEEARLAFCGCSPLLKPATRKALTFDIGGGSTEFMWAARELPMGLPYIVGWSSIPFGVMNLSEQFGGASYTEMYFDEIVSKIACLLREFDARHAIRATMDMPSEAVQLLSTSGTVTTLAAIYLDLPRYDRAQVDGATLNMADLRGAVTKLLAMSPAERYNHPCIGSQRADYIISGCAILEAIHAVWSLDCITIADRGVREGIIISMALKNRTKSPVVVDGK